MNKLDNKIVVFMSALSDVYRDEDVREGTAIPTIEFKEEELTEDFTAMVYAVYMMYKRITDDDVDVLGFTHLMNRLIFQALMEGK